jgi:hypothetical protein
MLLSFICHHCTRLVFEVIPRRINMHLPDCRLLLEGSQAAARAATAARREEESGSAQDCTSHAAANADAKSRSGKKQHRHYHLHRPKIAKHLMNTGKSCFRLGKSGVFADNDDLLNHYADYAPARCIGSSRAIYNHNAAVKRHECMI